MEENWIPIENFENLYEVSDFGRIRSIHGNTRVKAGYILKNGISPNGYPVICLHKEKKPHWFTVHRLVTHHFLGLRPTKRQVNHKDGDKTNNKISNLEYVTPSQNLIHARDVTKTLKPAKGDKHGLRLHPERIAIGSKHGRAKLTEEQVLKIRNLYNAKEYTQAQLSAMFNVSRSNISMIITRTNWNHI